MEERIIHGSLQNGYVYAINSPISLTDPTGRNPLQLKIGRVVLRNFVLPFAAYSFFSRWMTSLCDAAPMGKGVLAPVPVLGAFLGTDIVMWKRPIRIELPTCPPAYRMDYECEAEFFSFGANPIAADL